jgi:hypothetical protein
MKAPPSSAFARRAIGDRVDVVAKSTVDRELDVQPATATSGLFDVPGTAQSSLADCRNNLIKPYQPLRPKTDHALLAW